MNREDIIAMAREAGFDEFNGFRDDNTTSVYYEAWPEQLERFAALVAAAERNSWPAEMEAMERQVNILTDALAQAKAEEREACAKVCENFGEEWHCRSTTNEIATAIRARGETK